VGHPPAPSFEPGHATSLRLRLLGAFVLETDGVPARLPPAARRVLAFISLHERPLERAYLAGSLWLDSSDERAHANLRSALWRLRHHGRNLVDCSGSSLQLGGEVAIDLHESRRIAREVLAGAPPPADISAHLAALAVDVLPDWYEDWVMFERECHRQLRLRALEGLCEQLVAAGRADEALEAGLAAVAGEPLRESAYRAIVRVHIAVGNAGEAVRLYRLYRRVLLKQLGAEPSPLMEALIASLRVPAAHR
jgi:DNA-binding SARP family transcriptional activator